MFKNLKHTKGFTLIELVMIMVILGIVSITVLPKFWDDSTFYSQGFSKQLLATLRYAQKTAIVQHRLVCVNLAASTPATVTLNIASLNSDTTCSIALNLPGSSSNVLTAPSDITLNPATTVNFDALGRPSTSASISIPGVADAIIIEAETGYVHQ